MSLFPIPTEGVNKLDKLRSDFDEGLHLVKWEIVQLNKISGGLGLRNLKVQNDYLLMKWLWRYVEEEQAL